MTVSCECGQLKGEVRLIGTRIGKTGKPLMMNCWNLSGVFTMFYDDGNLATAPVCVECRKICLIKI